MPLVALCEHTGIVGLFPSQRGFTLAQSRLWSRVEVVHGAEGRGSIDGGQAWSQELVNSPGPTAAVSAFIRGPS